VPTLEENLDFWASYEWPEEGDEWSSEWGGTLNLWYGTIFPRVMGFLPAKSILEIAPGYGRCTQFLLSLCKELTVVDLSPKCVEACRVRFRSRSHIRVRFRSRSHIRYFVNDGRSLDMLEDNSLDFVFSWDSLVHAESDVIEAYVKQLSTKLKPGGAGFIHHSNMGSFKNPDTGELTVENRHWRATSMTAELFREYCKNAGITCVSQEIAGWGGTDLTDCFSLFARDAESGDRETVVVENKDFMEEAFRMKRISALYNPASIVRPL
jgi:ubiquinone/menaquinone biosynthesis C-methylase UbiE